MAACVSCGGALAFHRPYTFRSKVFPAVYGGKSVFRCRTCNLSQVDMALIDETALTAYYAHHYRVDTGDIAVLGATSEAIYRRRGKALVDLAMLHLDRTPRRVFEVGAGYGFNLSAFRDRFAEVWTATDEPSAVAAEYHAGRIERAGLADGGFDVIILSHVLEHFSDPVALLQRCAGALLPGGVIIVEVPNDVDGILRYNGEDEPHLTFFESDTLGRLFDRARVTVIDLFTAGPPNVRDTLAGRMKRMAREILGATPVGRTLLQRRSSGTVQADARFDQRTADGLFIRAALRA